MKRGKKINSGRPALELIEDATSLLRRMPAGLFLIYYAGSLPFILGFLFFWADMSRNAYAYSYLMEASLSLSLLYIWMKCLHCIFVERLMDFIYQRQKQPLSVKRILRMAVIQIAVQPAGLLILPAAILAVVPFGWVYAFCQNMTISGNGSESSIKKACRKAWSHAKLFQEQNHLVLGIISLFGFFVFLNVTSVVFIFPYLLKTLFGIETIYTMAPLSMLNTTFITAVFGLVFLLMGPVNKTIYVLRYFYGESIHTGEDIRMELKRYNKTGGIQDV